MKLDGWLLIIIILAVCLRVLWLERLPIFNDEAIYLVWGRTMTNSSTERYMSLRDGKPPLTMWLFGLIQKIEADPLVLGRLTSGFMGILTLWGIVLVGKAEQMPLWVIRLAAIIYAISPIFVFFDRQALMESSLAMIGVWSFLLIRRNPILLKFNWVLLGLVWSVGLWTKLNALGFVIAGLIVGFVKEKHIGDRVLWFLGALGVMVIFMFPLIQNGGMETIVRLNQRYSLEFGEILEFPMNLWITNFQSFLEITWWQLGGVGLLTLLSMFWNKKLRSELNPLIIYIGILVFGYIILVRNPSPRYLVAYLPLLLLVEAKCLTDQYRYRKLLISLSLFSLVVASLTLVSNPKFYLTKLSRVSAFSQKESYLNNYTSGYGVNEALAYIERQEPDKDKVVVIDLTPGNPQSTAELYLSNFAKTRIYYWSGSSKLPSFKATTFLLSRDDFMVNSKLEIIEEKRWYKSDLSHYVWVRRLE